MPASGIHQLQAVAKINPMHNAYLRENGDRPDEKEPGDHWAT